MKKSFIYDVNFRRKFSFNSYKNLRLKMGEMSFTSDFTSLERGDLYPIVRKSENVQEKVSDGKYILSSPSGKSEVCRILGQYVLNGTYSVEIEDCENGNIGISVMTNDASYDCGFETLDFYAKIKDSKLIFCYRKDSEETVVSEEIGFEKNMKIIFTFSLDYVDFHYEKNGVFCPVTSEKIPGLRELSYYKNFTKSTSALLVENENTAVLNEVVFFIDAGISQADMHVIKYENAMPIIEDGKIFLSVTSRHLNGGHQSILSWNYSTCEFKLEGILYFDCGDTMWCSDIASSIVFDRNKNEWYIWYCSFSHGHVIARGMSKNDIRFGINVIDSVLMQKKDCMTDSDFFGKEGDEDPDITYDPKTEKWYLTICRSVKGAERNWYRYFLFESDNPLDNFVFKDKILSGSNTGGSFLRVKDKIFFVCGSDADKRAKYNIYPLEDFSDERQLKCNFDDGGFRGWGTVVPVFCGNRTKYMWITFDRVLHGLNNWSYGNIYVFESDLMHDGYIK